MFLQPGASDEADADAERVEAGEALTNASPREPAQLRASFRGVMAVNKESKPLEVSLGLAAQLVRLMGPRDLAHHLAGGAGGVSVAGLVGRLVGVLVAYACLSIKAPQIRRFAVEPVIALLRTVPGTTAEAMVAAGLREELRHGAKMMSALECFHVFSGSAGLSRHAIGLAALVDTALELMAAATANNDEAEPEHLCMRLSESA